MMIYWPFITIAQVPSVSTQRKGEPIRRIREVRSSMQDGQLSVSLEVTVAKFCLPETCYWTRTYNGSIPGPTIRLRPGDAFALTIINHLSEKDNDITKSDQNNFGHINTTNIHVHGLRVSPIEDDVEPIILPGQQRTYRYTLSRMGGASAWYHPHSVYDGHGSATIQWAGGMFGAIIVEDMNEKVKNNDAVAIEDLVLHLQNVAFDNDSPMNLKNLQYNDDDNHIGFDEFRWRFNKDLLQPEPAWKGSHLLVNGQVEPIISLDPIRWTRLRIFSASTYFTVHTRLIGDCQWLLLTKDGIPVRHAPRRFGILPLWPGARADIYIHCTANGAWILDPGDSKFGIDERLDYHVLGGYFSRDYSYYVKRGSAVLATFEPLKALSIKSSTTIDPEFPQFTFNPLPDLASLAVPNQRAVLQFMRHSRKNHRIYDIKSDPSHIHVKAGSVIEYDIYGLAEHPVHFHAHPFQLISVEKNASWTFPTFEQHCNAGYMQIGDWHDTIQLYLRMATFRQQPIYPGYIPFHCHVVQHADFGMMGHIKVSPPSFRRNPPSSTEKRKSKRQRRHQ